MAAPFLTGVVALMVSINDSLTPEKVMILLKDNAENLGLEQDKQGYGIIRADKV